MSADRSLAALRDTLRESGVVGAGGAGYPAWAKLAPCADLILNGAESEPLCTAHSQLLTRHPREALLARVWGARYEGGPRTVDIHVRRLRMKLGDALPLETLRGAGYKLRTPGER